MAGSSLCYLEHMLGHSKQQVELKAVLPAAYRHAKHETTDCVALNNVATVSQGH